MTLNDKCEFFVDFFDFFDSYISVKRPFSCWFLSSFLFSFYYTKPFYLLTHFT